MLYRRCNSYEELCSTAHDNLLTFCCSCNGPLCRSSVPARPRKFLIHQVITSPRSTRTCLAPDRLRQPRPHTEFCLPRKGRTTVAVSCSMEQLFVYRKKSSQGIGQTTDAFCQISDSFGTNFQISNTGASPTTSVKRTGKAASSRIQGAAQQH